MGQWIRGARAPVPEAVRMPGARNARRMGPLGRGTFEVGSRAAPNPIDPGAIRHAAPRRVRELPASARRFVQGARGYRATRGAGRPVFGG